MNKKAISPLISTLLLIFFAVALGLVVMSWGRTAQLEEVEEKTCEEVSIGIMKIAGQEICYKDSTLKYTLENTGSVRIDKIKLFIISDDIEKIDQDAIIQAADIVKLESSYQTKEIKKIKITPGVQDIFCPKNGVEIDVINECG